MAKRTPRQQSKHDKAVKKTADYYKGLGYNVQADIKNYDQPDTINKRRPDVIAKKGKETVVVEVETNDSIKTDQKQIETFKEYADDHKNTKFRLKKA